VDLLAPDAALPHRDALLDVSVMAARIPALIGVPPGSPVGPIARIRTKYRIGRSVRVLHRLPVAGTDHFVSTRMATPARIPRLVAAARVGCCEVAGLRAVVHDEDLDAVSWVFPCDRKLSGLDTLIGDGGSNLAGISVPASTTEVVAYAPEKSVTFRARDAAGLVTAYLKVYAERDRFAGTVDRYRRVAGAIAAAGVRVPNVIGCLPECRLLVLEAVPGWRLDQLRGNRLVAAMHALGRALASLHQVPADSEPDFDRFSPGALYEAAATIAAARPDAAGPALTLLERLDADSPPTGSTLVHGDVHLKNGLMYGGDVHLVDLDQCGRGHPAADVGSVLAGLRHRRLVGGITQVEEDQLRAAFLAGYATHDVIDAAALRWHTVAALLVERAARAVHRVLPTSLTRLPALLHEADAVLATSRSGAR
jgi:Ser/Thr protein kinase RdoA (MazF antagonist)